MSDLGRDDFMLNERRRAQNRLAQRRHRQKKAFKKQIPVEQDLAIDAEMSRHDVPAEACLSPSEGTVGLNTIDSFSPLLAFNMGLSTLPSSWNANSSILTEPCDFDVSSAALQGPAETDLLIPPSILSIEDPETTRLAVLSFSRNIIPRPNPTFSNNRNESLIHTAARGNDVATLQLLVQAGFELNDRDHEGRTALHAAYEEHHIDAMVWLLGQGIDVHAVDKQGRTILSMAVNNKCPVAVRLMLSHGANQPPNNRGRRGHEV